ncbi:MAG: DNA mismatch repair endonuclease MutL [Chitinophagaceae bacterium]|nr:DNA mismatch repair endonuclease MutL [Chitinophagaceae bacterium]
MGDIIQLLPDNIANQIAAGEVIQRPASAAKELLENAVDAGATEIRLTVQDAGKALIQVSDNGKGMTGTDARMCFERHATSKIREIDDLFHIRTMGFRGEALASIAAVAQVELKTKRAEDQTGNYLEIDNSVVRKQEIIACANGTSIAMKNLFFNVPARRNFLKSNPAEMRHIVDEFIRVALSFPDVFFSLTSNGERIFHLDRGSLKQRIVQILGNQYNSKLVTVQEKTDYMTTYGFVGKPDISKKTRGDQYLFVNNRFIRSAYLNHAIMSAYQDMIPSDSFPLYVLFIDLDPVQVDVNVHPTKQEIKFEDEKIVYAFVQAAIKHSLAQFSVTPALDFDLDPSIQHLESISKPVTDENKADVVSSSLYKSFSQKHQAHIIESRNSGLKEWKSLMDGIAAPGSVSNKAALEFENSVPVFDDISLNESCSLIQVFKTYIIAATNRGFVVVHQQLAHERVLYEKLIAASSGRAVAYQRSLFPATLDLSTQDAVLLSELLNELLQLGYLVESFGQNSFVIQGTPADLVQGNEKAVIENLLEQFKHFSSDVKFSKREKIVRSLAGQQAVKPGTELGSAEMTALVKDLFASATPGVTANGSPTYVEFKKEYMEQLFKRG